MNIAFFGSSLLSAYWNGAATYYRGMVRALSERGHAVTFYEPDAYERQQHRDIEPPPWARSIVYANEVGAMQAVLESARGSDIVIKASGVGVFDAELEAGVLDLQGGHTQVLFWDVDAPATLERVQTDAADPFRSLIPRYDAVLTYGGGAPVVDAYKALGARSCVPIYNALDPQTHFPVAPDSRFGGALGFLGNRLPDREARVEEFFWKPAALCPDETFLLGGAGWDDHARGASTTYLGHVYTADHNAFHGTPRLALNISRDSMARFGFSPATRVFEATGAGACLISDWWQGIEQFFEPEREILVAKSGEEVAEFVRSVSEERAREVGAAALKRALADHTYAQRAEQFERALEM
jgi:spore maturation protein CgeB